MRQNFDRPPPRTRKLAAAALLALVLTMGFPAGAASPAEGASRVNQVLEALKRPKSAPTQQRFELAEADLNDFVGVVVAARKSSGLKSLWLDLRPEGVISGVAVVDMDRVTVGGWIGSAFKSVLSGTQTVKTSGRLSVTGRRAEFDLENASFNDVWVPVWLVNTVLGRLGGSPGGIDITEPFDLPYEIADVRVESDRLVIIR